MFDFSLSSDSFSSTEVTVSPSSPAGKKFFEEFFGAGVSSVNMPKSKADDFLRFVQAKGLKA